MSVGVLKHMLACAGSSDGSETNSDEGSPLGPKGGGTLKTCAICLEDYRSVCAVEVLHVVWLRAHETCMGDLHMR